MPIIELTLSDGTTRRVEIDGEPTEELIQNEIIPAIESGALSNNDISTEPIQEEVQTNPAKKGIDLTPSGLLQKGTAAALSPISALIRGTSIPEAYNETMRRNAEYEQKHPILSGIPKFGVDMYAYGKIPMVKGNNALANFLANTGIQGTAIGGLEGLKNGDALGGAGRGTLIAGAINGIMPPAVSGISTLANKIANSKSLPKILEGLTSVPEKYTKTALENEMAGNSLFEGKFDADTAYRPIEQKLTAAKAALPTKEQFAEKFYNLGQKASNGLSNLKANAENAIFEALGKLNDRAAAADSVQNAVNTIIKQYGEGGVYNSALEEAPQVVNYLNDVLKKEGLTLRDLHRIKERLYDMGYQADNLKQGTAAQVARGTANQINNYLRHTVPEYIAPNEMYSEIANLERELGGLNQNTIGGKLSRYGSPENLQSGLDIRLRKLNDMLPAESKFIDDVAALTNQQDDISRILNTIGKNYERNPRLLGNRTDEAFENAINDLQNESGIEFMPELEKIRARDALEKIFSGQGGGSGSAQGFGNLIRSKVLPTVIGSAAAGPVGGISALTGSITLTSPKFMAQGTVKNLGKLSKIKDSKAVNTIQKLLSPLAIKSQPMLYGGVSNTTDNYTDYDTTQY